MAIVNTTLSGNVTIFPNQAKAPCVETLKWKTNLIVSQNGSETTYQVRSLPRVSYSYRIPFNNYQYQDATNTFYGSRNNKWCIPLWSEMQKIGPVSPAANIIASTTYSDFRNDSLALLWESFDKWQIIEIQYVNPGSLDLYNNTISFDDAWLMPLRIGYLSKNANRNTDSFNGEFICEFEIEDYGEPSELAPTQYLFNDIYFDEWLKNDSKIKDVFNQKIDYFDQELGSVSRYSPWINMKPSRPMVKILSTPQDVYNFRRFLSRRKGKYRKFWQPTFDNDLVNVSSGVVSNVIKVRRSGYGDHSSSRDHIAIQDVFGSWHAREILSFVASGAENYDITIDSNLNLNSNEIKTISFLSLKRFETDNIELNWIGGGVCKTQIKITDIEP